MRILCLFLLTMGLQGLRAQDVASLEGDLAKLSSLVGRYQESRAAGDTVSKLEIKSEGGSLHVSYDVYALHGCPPLSFRVNETLSWESTEGVIVSKYEVEEVGGTSVTRRYSDAYVGKGEYTLRQSESKPQSWVASGKFKGKPVSFTVDLLNDGFAVERKAFNGAHQVLKFRRR